MDSQWTTKSKQLHAIGGFCLQLVVNQWSSGGQIVSRKNQIARSFILVALKKNVRRPFCETAETIEHFILPMSHNGLYVNFTKLISILN